MIKRLTSIFKKPPASYSISPEMAVGYVLKSTMDDLPLKWENIKHEIIGYNEIFHDIAEDWVQFEFALASLGFDLLALYNLYPEQQAEQMHNLLLTLLGQIENIGENSETAVHDYFLVASEGVSKNENPMEYVASFLCHRLYITDDIGPIALSGIIVGILQFTGRWKTIKTNFEIA